MESVYNAKKTVNNVELHSIMIRMEPRHKNSIAIYVKMELFSIISKELVYNAITQTILR